MRRSARSIEDIQTVVVDAALALGGDLEGIAMPTLAKAAGVAVGTLYRVAENKAALTALVQQMVGDSFNSAVLAPFPASLDYQARYGLILERMVRFAADQPAAADYIARQPVDVNSALYRAAAGFARDGAAVGALKPLNGAEMVALTWGPVASLILSRAIEPERTKALASALWPVIAADGLATKPIATGAAA